MPATPLTIYTVPFQGFIDLTTNNTPATAEMTFVNDGYTVMNVVNSDPANALTLTITGVRDNAGRSKTITQVVAAAGGYFMFGPFRPIFFNKAGDVQVSFSTGDEDGVPNTLANIGVKVMKLQF